MSEGNLIALFRNTEFEVYTRQLSVTDSWINVEH